VPVRNTDRQTDRQTWLKIRALQSCKGANRQDRTGQDRQTDRQQSDSTGWKNKCCDKISCSCFLSSQLSPHLCNRRTWAGHMLISIPNHSMVWVMAWCKSVMARAHSFPWDTEFRHELRNLSVLTEFPYFCGMLRNCLFTC